MTGRPARRRGFRHHKNLDAPVCVYTITNMTTWDETKRAANLTKHGVDFALAEGFDWDTALTSVDERQSYGEHRCVSVGFIGDRLYVMVWTPRDHGVRIIGLRKANEREQRRYRAREA